MAVVLFGAQPGHAANAGDFRAGRIIDDAVFTNKSAMSVSDIQNFLNSKVPVCDTNGTKPSEFGGGTRAQYGASIGQPAPYVCLKDYSEGGRSAAQIIYDAAQTYSINPRVILVTLQKENGLIKDEWPFPLQYRTAMGFGCPDGAPCDAQWYGFTNQVNQGARHFRGFFDNSLSFVPYRPGNNFIQYNPNSGCGGTTINIQNKATAALYSYTPYQPNAAALNNLYGLGDGCSAYGNRNFWRDYTDWFGSTFGIQTNWKFETLDGYQASVLGNNENLGAQPSAVIKDGKQYVAYYNVTRGTLDLAIEMPVTGWLKQTLDGDSSVGGRVNARVGWRPEIVIYNNSLHVFYYDLQNGNLRHAWSNGSVTSWQFEVLDGAGGGNGRIDSNVGQGPSIATTGGQLHVFYYSVTDKALRHAWWTDGSMGWKFEFLDGVSSSVSRFRSDVGYESAAMYLNNSLQLFYYDASNGNLRHAWDDGVRGWRFENLDGDRGSIAGLNANLGRSPVAIGYGSGIQLFYADTQNGNLRHAWTTPQGWRFENLDGDSGAVSKYPGNIGLHASAAQYNGTLQVFYYDWGRGVLRHAFASQRGWGFEDFDGSSTSLSQGIGDMGSGSSIISTTTQLHVYYPNSSLGDLRHAWFIP